MEKLQDKVEYLFIDRESDLYNQAIELRYKEFFEGFNRPKEQVFDGFEDMSIRIVAHINKKVIGHARLFIEDSCGEISQVVVDKQYRGMKIGIGIMNRLVDIASKNNVKLIGLDARVYAIDFYKTIGFETIGDIFASKKTGLPHIRMIKEFN